MDSNVAVTSVLPGAASKVVNRRRSRRVGPRRAEAARLRLGPRYSTYLARV